MVMVLTWFWFWFEAGETKTMVSNHGPTHVSPPHVASRPERTNGTGTGRGGFVGFVGIVADAVVDDAGTIGPPMEELPVPDAEAAARGILALTGKKELSDRVPSVACTLRDGSVAWGAVSFRLYRKVSRISRGEDSYLT
ncbi:hypothetical protein DFH08DRAFT_1026033 [Mycena albidolilacea]|uniref:Uncharacterized protein n=1 Tax=Mycena albidolilacea TaxID=1033008 RepID=A0AAD6ZKX3_9AGAR|nr:hypothetical protein DFH08DRAFT_1026033 [Mycena albidolilacea]